MGLGREHDQVVRRVYIGQLDHVEAKKRIIRAPRSYQQGLGLNRFLLKKTIAVVCPS